MKRRRLNEDGCWLWTGHLVRNGYGEIAIPGGRKYVHRLAYELFVGPIPDGMQLDHRCHSNSPRCIGICEHRACFNPDHLEPVTARENNLRSRSLSAAHARKTSCPNGHPYDYATPTGRRRCRTCDNAKRNQRRKKRGVRFPSAANAAGEGSSPTRATGAGTPSPAPFVPERASSAPEGSRAHE